MTKSYFIFIANDILLSPKKKLSADEIANTLLSQGFWAFSEQEIVPTAVEIEVAVPSPDMA